MARVNHVPHLFSMKHLFLEVNTAFLSIQKEESKKKFEFRTKILATQNSVNKNNAKYER